MADGALVLVDAAEGPDAADPVRALQGARMRPAADRGDQQDRSPRRPAGRSAERGLRAVPGTRAPSDELADFPYIFASGRGGYATHDPSQPGDSIQPLLDMVLERVPGPEVDPDAPLQMLVTTLDWSDYVGRIAIGRIQSGNVRRGEQVALMQARRSDRQRESHGAVSVRQARPRRGRGSDRRRHRGGRRPGGRRDRRHGERPRDAAGPAAAGTSMSRRCKWSSASTPRRWPAGGQVRHQPASARSADARAGAERRPARRADRGNGDVLRLRPRPAAPGRADRNDAPRRLRALDRQAAGHHAASRTASPKSRSSRWSSKCRTTRWDP